MIRRLLKWLLRLAVLALVLVLLLLIFKDSLLRVAAENAIRAQTGMDVKIGKFSSGILSPVVTIEDLKLYNPPSFGGTPFLDLRELHVEFDPAALSQRRLHVTLARFNLAEIDVVRNELGQTNIFALTAKSSSQKAPGNKAPPPVQIRGKTFQFDGVDVLNLSIGRARFVDLKEPKNNREFAINVQNQVFKNVKTESDLSAIAFILWLRSNGQLQLGDGPHWRL